MEFAKVFAHKTHLEIGTDTLEKPTNGNFEQGKSFHAKCEHVRRPPHHNGKCTAHTEQSHTILVLHYTMLTELYKETLGLGDTNCLSAFSTRSRWRERAGFAKG